MKTLILICALGLARADCQPETAVAVIQGPEAGGAAQCGFYGQAYVADTAVADYLDGEHYLKIRCTNDRARRPATPRDQDLALDSERPPVD